MTEPVLRVDDLSITYTVGAGVFQAVTDVSLRVYPKQVIGIVGETGCGKSACPSRRRRSAPAGSSFGAPTS
ncbi:MAG: hypothetical protein L3J91_02305 [Thermoplasmata archaeon]|nr:hypothetical protein [Thermoplasmata archaeon]